MPSLYSSSSTPTDPRSASRVIYYTNSVSPDEIPADYYSIASLVFGMAALTLRLKFAAWLSFFACISSLANQKASERDWKQILTSFGFALIGLAVNYIAVKPEDYPI